MGEWKRIYSDPRRIFTLLLISLLSVVFFFYGRMPYFGPGSVSALIEGERYYADIIGRSRGLSTEGIGAMLDEEYNVIDSYYTLRVIKSSDFLLIPEDELKDAVKKSEFLSSVEELDDESAEHILNAAETRLLELYEQHEYISGYAEYLDKVQRQAEQQSMTSIFGDENSFSHRNIVKTAEEFDKLRGTEVEFGANRAYEGWISYELADYFYLLVIIIFVLSFLEERRAGLWGVIRSSKGGRLRLGLTRVLILASACVLGVFLIYGVNLLFSLTLSGGWGDTGRAIQSMVSFRTFTQKITIGGFIIEYLLVKAASGFAVGLFLWAILGSVSNVQYSLAVLGVVVAVEYILFAFLPVQSIFNPVKYFNLFSYIRTSKLYTEYLNIDLFGFPFGIRRLSLAFLPVFAAICFILVLAVCRKRPEGRRDLISAVVGVWDKCADFFRRHFTTGGWEAYKFLIFERGIILLVIIFIASGSLSYYRYVSTTSDMSTAYLKDMAGPITKKTDEYIENAREYTNGNGELLSALDKVEARVAELRARAEAGGYEPWIANDTHYKSVYGPNAVDLQRVNAAVAIVFTVVSCAAVMSFENQSGVVYMLRAQKRGRGHIFVRKMLVSFGAAAFSFGIVYIREFLWLKSTFPAAIELAVPIRNFDVFASSPLNVTIGQYLLILYAARFSALLILSFAVMLVSSCVRTNELSYMLNLLFFGIPALLFALGIDVMRLITPVLAVSSAEGMWSLCSSQLDVSSVITWVVWLAAGVAAAVICFRRWCAVGKR